jgi:hypothetical protein
VLAVFTSGIFAQELDSLKAIMENKSATEKTENPDNTAHSPVIIDDKGDIVKIQVGAKEVIKVVENEDTTYVKLGEKKIIEVIDQRDSTRIRVGDKEISIVEKGDNPTIQIDNAEEEDISGNPKFRGHWAGFEWGINNFLDKDFTISREGEDFFMDLNTGRSWCIDLNLAQYSLGFGTSHFGILTGLGLEYNNYFFDSKNSIVEKNDMVVDTILDPSVSKSKLATAFLRMPLIFETQFPNVIRSKRIYLSAGLVVGLKLGSHTKIAYKDDSGKSKDKNNDDFNISPFRYGLTTRLGYGNVSIFGDYYFTTMFVKDKGPELHPFSLGLSFTF